MPIYLNFNLIFNEFCILFYLLSFFTIFIIAARISDLCFFSIIYQIESINFRFFHTHRTDTILQEFSTVCVWHFHKLNLNSYVGRDRPFVVINLKSLILWIAFSWKENEKNINYLRKWWRIFCYEYFLAFCAMLSFKMFVLIRLK